MKTQRLVRFDFMFLFLLLQRSHNDWKLFVTGVTINQTNYFRKTKNERRETIGK